MWTLNNIGKDQGNHCADWVYELQKLDEKYPGMLVAIHSLILQQTSMHENMRLNYEAAQNYSRGDEALSRMGKNIIKAQAAPSGNRGLGGSGGGGTHAGRIVGNWG